MTKGSDGGAGHDAALPAAGRPAADPDLAVTGAAAVADYRRRAVRKVAAVVALIAICLVAFLASTAVGALDFSWSTVLKGIFSPDAVDQQTRTVLWRLRLPAAVMAVLVGASLALAGAQMQTILDNPLAEPFTLGISAAAAFGGAAVIVQGWRLLPNAQFNLALFAWAAAMLAVSVVIGASVWRGAGAESMILLGIALVFLFQALLALMQYRADQDALQQIVFWTMGSMGRSNWTAVGIVLASLVIAVPYVAANSWKLTALRLGDARAAAMGIDVKKLRIITLVVVSLLAATSVAFVGIIGFIGLVGPHVARILVGEDQRFFVPAAMAAGAMLLTCAHALSLMLIPGRAIPIGIITALVGVPFFLALLFTRKRQVWG
ncbi:FecCD family ABC transporter permease [Corynebacterium sphenisci]|uniref:FecCD family ABC transporter permease n=1 Tax=Corynebacterium sphenisci TaxID=191493 RepID=UPI0026DFEEA8|nr:iron ABC transporter permease [Corynebacterium sphenisci]MDO5731308.1 iron ABC transporter permease [Corynebacterium sphenisci]